MLILASWKVRRQGQLWANLQKAIASDCQVIHLEDGEYTLSSTLGIWRSLKLVGNGRDKTRIISEAGEQVVKYQDNGELILKNISFEHKGTKAASILFINGGEVNIENCTFKGAKWGENLNSSGNGIIFFSGSTGSVKSSIIKDNESSGIDIRGQSQPTLEGNTLRRNQDGGIVYFDNAGGIARNNTVTNNGHEGIYREPDTNPILEGNQGSGNGDGNGILIDYHSN